MKKYLFLPTSDENFEEIMIIVAMNLEKAFEIFTNIQIDEENFLNYVYEKCINSGFAENFWELGEEFMKTGKVSINDEKFKENVQIYFKNKPEHGELFIKYYFMSYEESKNYTFPSEMLSYIYKNSYFCKEDWKIFDIEDIPVLK